VVTCANHLVHEGHTSIEEVRARYASMVKHPFTGHTEAGDPCTPAPTPQFLPSVPR
jgi:hypothetical protein